MQRFVMDYLEDSALMFPDKVALADVNTKITYNDLRNKAKSIASYIAFNIDAACCIYDSKNENIELFYQAKEQCDRELLVALGKSLPKYMFPNRLMHFALLPLNKNAKLNRTLLKGRYIDGENK